jgi:hypothetical protein
MSDAGFGAESVFSRGDLAGVLSRIFEGLCVDGYNRAGQAGQPRNMGSSAWNHKGKISLEDPVADLVEDRALAGRGFEEAPVGGGEHRLPGKGCEVA